MPTPPPEAIPLDLHSIALQEDEVRPVLKLSPEEIERLEAEKRELADVARAVRKSDRTRIRGEGSALDEDKPALAPLRVVQPEPAFTSREQAPLTNMKITADPEVLMRLMTAAKEAGEEAETARILCDTAEAEATATREALQDYMREHGLA